MAHPFDSGEFTKSEVASSPIKTKNRKGGLKKILVLLIVLALLGGGAFFVYKYDQAQKEVDRLSNPQEAAREEVDRLKEQVGRLVEVPADETPTVATVVDPAKLQSQPFFAKSATGDKVLIFSNAKRAILYRPSTNKVIEIAPINIGQNQQSPPEQAE